LQAVTARGAYLAAALLNRLMHLEDRHRRDSHDFSDNIIGDVDISWLLSVDLHIFDVKRGADQPPIAQGDLSYAMPNGCDADRRRWCDREWEWLDISKGHFVPHVFCPESNSAGAATAIEMPKSDLGAEFVKLVKLVKSGHAFDPLRRSTLFHDPDALILGAQSWPS
jgi:hypothetical protein